MKRTLEIELYVCGIEIFQSYKSDCLSVEKKEIKHRQQHLTNCLDLQYRVLLEPDSTVPEQTYINRVLLEEVNLFLQSLSLLLARPTQLIDDKTKLDGIDVKLDLPARGAPLGLYNIAARWDRGFSNRRYSCKVQNDGWPLLEKLLSEFRQKPGDLRKQLALPLRWFTKGSDDMSSIDRLMAFWISFNALYVDSATREQDAIESYIQNNLDIYIAQRYVESNNRILQKLAGLPIELGRGSNKRQVARELANLLNDGSPDYIRIVKIAALTIYGIRNNLFHGAYDPNAEDEQVHTQIAENLLSRLVKELIGKLMLGHALPPVKFVIQERVGF